MTMGIIGRFAVFAMKSFEANSESNSFQKIPHDKENKIPENTRYSLLIENSNSLIRIVS